MCIMPGLGSAVRQLHSLDPQYKYVGPWYVKLAAYDEVIQHQLARF